VPPLAHQPPHGPHLPHQAIAQAQAAQTILQNQMNILQQQLSMNNPVHVSAEQIAQMQAQQHQRLAQMALHQQQQHQQQEQTSAHSGMQDQRNSDHSLLVNSNQPSQTSQGHPPGAPLSMGPTTTTIHEAIGPHGSRVRVVVNETVNYHTSRQGTPVPAGPGMGQQPSANAPLHAPPNAVSNFQFLVPPGGSLPQLGLPFPHPNSLFTSGRQPSTTPSQYSNSTTLQAASANTTAWLLSTPLGPQALVFAPGHGYFSSAPTHTTAVAQFANPNQPASYHNTSDHPQSSGDHVGHTSGLPNNPPVLPVANDVGAVPAQAAARPGQQQQQQQQGQANRDNDIFHLILQRGWLFLRLYIFTFVLSEPGTWRRWSLLAMAVIVCLLPRENPLRDLTNRLRAHIDGLVPIAAAPEQRQQGQAAQNGAQAANNDGQARPAAGVAAQQPSPEQAAARIIRQNQERQNHGIVRDAIFRVERAMALFLASLVPGVGERHVRAREEARREAERIENERLAAENARIAEETTKNESKATSVSSPQRDETHGEPSAANSGEEVATSS
jgi:hypothetical protein